MFAGEFTLYLMEHPDLMKKLPRRAQIVFHLEGKGKFNQWARALAQKHREKGYPVVVVRVKALALRSRLVRPRIEAIAA